MLLDAGENLIQLGKGLCMPGAAQHEMEQSQADQRSWIHRNISRCHLKAGETLGHNFFAAVRQIISHRHGNKRHGGRS
jgi:hypothetical protein